MRSREFKIAVLELKFDIRSLMLVGKSLGSHGHVNVVIVVKYMKNAKVEKMEVVYSLNQGIVGEN